ncbi:MAG: 2-C-methyl-D-erythritol 2,4-cyclodiphosphate synthase [Bacteroidales bacterium]|nr:2-C-methyl-D-erythritol 2,4-cyclodiphosphate synthase [Bacteroidales bacterium]
MNYRVGTGYDVHRLVKGEKLIFGGVNIPFEKGSLGHSDADVLLHAICDALLGSLSLGDIGTHFPDTDEKWKDVSSLLLLENVNKLIRDNGYSIANIDTTLILQQPKIQSYIPEIRDNIAKVLNIDREFISVKATTTERLGFIGRGEGVSAQAICLVNKA